MRDSDSYVAEKLQEAVEILCIGQGDVRSRLEEAFMSLPLFSSDFPPEFQADWEWIEKQMTKYGPVVGKDGRVSMSSVKHTMGRIRNRTGQKIAQRIFNLYWGLLEPEEE